MARPLLSLPALALATALPGPAPAEPGLQEITCRFLLECLGTEGCQATDYQMQIRYVPDPNAYVPADPTTTPPDIFTVEVSDVSGTFKAAPITDGSFGARLFGFTAFNGEHTQRLLTISGGVGRYSVHQINDRLALYYEGTCEEAE
ncbi:MAG: hypothetical protein R3D78_11660 [Paracoccaceae bacterium]|jgi:hypothetical protein